MSYHRTDIDMIDFYACFDALTRQLCSCSATGTWNIGKVVRDHEQHQHFARSRMSNYKYTNGADILHQPCGCKRDTLGFGFQNQKCPKFHTVFFSSFWCGLLPYEVSHDVDLERHFHKSYPGCFSFMCLFRLSLRVYVISQNSH